MAAAALLSVVEGMAEREGEIDRIDEFDGGLKTGYVSSFLCLSFICLVKLRN